LLSGNYFMQIQVLLFGGLADIAGSSVSVTNVTDTDSLIHVLLREHPGLADIKYVIAVNKQVVNKNTSLHADSVVALLPPFSGG
jgi:sulfur-carrier protein